MINFKFDIDLNLKGKTKILDKSQIHEILKNFDQFGILRFKNLTSKPENLIKFTDLFSKSYSNDAARRSKRLDSEKIRNVDLGFQEIKLHSEASFSPARPEIIWFYCLKPPKENSGKTTYCDGIELWEKLSGNTKKFFLQEPVCYSLKIPVNGKITGKGKKPWFLNNPGVKNCFLDFDNKVICFDYIKFAVQESRLANKLAFANHLFVSLESEPQLISRKMYSGKKIPTEIENEIYSISEKITKKITWKEKDLIMIDNQRYMHGREKINKDDKDRDIVNIQTAKTSFNADYFYKLYN